MYAFSLQNPACLPASRPHETKFVIPSPTNERTLYPEAAPELPFAIILNVFLCIEARTVSPVIIRYHLRF